MFVGGPSFTQPWGRITGDREPGSPQWRPVYEDGQVVRFAGVPDDYAQPAGEWGPPRVAYLQHANDPVLWWSPGLLVREPDWLREPSVPGRTPTTRWYPVLTFLQVTVDQFVGVSVPQGQGHNYGTQMPATLTAAIRPGSPTMSTARKHSRKDGKTHVGKSRKSSGMNASSTATTTTASAIGQRCSPRRRRWSSPGDGPCLLTVLMQPELAAIP